MCGMERTVEYAFASEEGATGGEVFGSVGGGGEGYRPGC